MKQNLIILTAALIALTGGMMAQQFTVSAKTPRPANPQLNFTLPDVSGAARNINEWQGKTLIINFWATWCPPCLKEIPEFIKLQQELTQQKVQFIGIALEEKEAVADFLRSHPINYPILIGGDSGIALSQQLGNVVGTVPFTLIVNRTGQVIHRQAGELSRARLLEILKPLIE